MKLFESEQEKADRLVKDEVYIKISFNFEESINLKNLIICHFMEQYYGDSELECKYDDSEAYAQARMSKLSNKDIVDMFQEIYCSKDEMIKDIMREYIDEDDLHVDVSIDTGEDEDEDWDNDEGEDDWCDEACEEDLEEEFIGGIDESSNESTAPLNSIASKIREAA